jgi:hypothetical protein
MRNNPTKVIWTYTDGDNGLLSFSTTKSATAYVDSDGIHLNGGGEAWGAGHAFISLPFNVSGKSVKVKMTYKDLSVPSWGALQLLFLSDTTRFYTQRGGVDSTFIYPDGSSVYTTKVVGKIPKSGSLALEYQSDSMSYSIYVNDVHKVTYQNKPSSDFNGHFAAMQQGSDTGNYSVIITKIEVELLGG